MMKALSKFLSLFKKKKEDDIKKLSATFESSYKGVDIDKKELHKRILLNFINKENISLKEINDLLNIVTNNEFNLDSDSVLRIKDVYKNMCFVLDKVVTERYLNEKDEVDSVKIDLVLKEVAYNFDIKLSVNVEELFEILEKVK
ncbi:MAG: hypothetical protein QXF12_02570 [Candidatus Aenigmatarchaeota archaeon]